MGSRTFVLMGVWSLALGVAGWGVGMMPGVEQAIAAPAWMLGLAGVLTGVLVGYALASRRSTLDEAMKDWTEFDPVTAGIEPARSTRREPQHVSTFFADLQESPTATAAAYTPSLDSVMFALADFEPTRDNAIDRTRSNDESESEPARAASPIQPPRLPAAAAPPSPAAVAADRPLHNVASVSPFGASVPVERTEPAPLQIAGSINGTLGALTDLFGSDEDDRVLPVESAPSLRRTTGSVAVTSAPVPRPVPAAASEAAAVSQPARPVVDAGVGPVQSVGLFAAMFGSTSEDSEPAPRSASAPAPAPVAPRPAAQPMPFRNSTATAVPLTPVASTPAAIERANTERSNALAGLRSVRPSNTRPAVPVSAVEAAAAAGPPSPNRVGATTVLDTLQQVKAARPAVPAAAVPITAQPAASVDDILGALPGTDEASRQARQARRNRPTAEQRVITARLQMGMLRNHAEDERTEFKKGQVPTPRKNAPSNLIMLSKRPEDMLDGTTSEDEVRQLYREFVAALNRCGRSAEIVQYAAFAQRIHSQKRKVRAQFDGARVNMVVRVTEGRPKIVMRPAV